MNGSRRELGLGQPGTSFVEHRSDFDLGLAADRVWNGLRHGCRAAVRAGIVDDVRRTWFSIALMLCSMAPVGAPAMARDAALPAGQSPDFAAWTVLARVAAPVRGRAGAATEFETWASDRTLFGTNPPDWPKADTVSNTPRQSPVGQLSRGMVVLGDAIQTCAPPHAKGAGGFPLAACIWEDVRYNRPSFDYVVSHDLFSRAGLAAAARRSMPVDFPSDAIIIKADWIKLRDLQDWQDHRLPPDAIRRVYFTQDVDDHSAQTEYVLLSLHVSTKQIKNWIWSDFEHELNPGRCDDIGCHDGFGAAEADVGPRNAPSAPPSDASRNRFYGACAKTAALEAMLKAAGLPDAWRHYCLKGTQVDYVRADGSDVLLGNSVIERINSNVPVVRSSCMTCHAAAAFDRAGAPGTVPDGPVGLFGRRPTKDMIPSDFVWGLSRAR